MQFANDAHMHRRAHLVAADLMLKSRQDAMHECGDKRVDYDLLSIKESIEFHTNIQDST